MAPKNGTNGHGQNDQDRHFDLAASTLTGDLRDACLVMIKQMKKPWEKLSENEQRNVANGISASCHELVMKSVALVRSEARPHVSARLDKVAIDDKGTKLTVSGVIPTDDAVVDVSRMQGRRIILIETDHSPFVGERKPFKPDPDQRTLDDAEPTASA